MLLSLDSSARTARAMSGVPIFPATTAGEPALVRIWPMSEVVVVFPFEPVTPISRPRRKRQPSSISLQTGTPAARAVARRARRAPKIERAAERPQLRHGLAELLGGAIVDGGHQGAPRGAELCRGDARARQSQHQHALACEFDSRT